MLESVHIQNFKGFRDTRIDGFCPVNLVIGGQNVGKTSLLEAVLFSLRGAISTDFRQSQGSDGIRLAGSWASRSGLKLTAGVGARRYGICDARLAPNAEVVRREGMSSEISVLVPTGVLSRPPERVALPLFLPAPDHLVTLTGRVILNKKKRDLLELLRKIEPRLQSLDAIAPDGEHRVYAELDGLPQALPLSHLGHGFSRLVHLFSELLVSDASLALVDEIENGIHYSALPTLFQGVRAVAQERQVQTLMTTHSWDALRAASEVFADTPELFQVIRLERTADDNVEAVRIDGPRLQRLIAQDREVR